MNLSATEFPVIRPSDSSITNGEVTARAANGPEHGTICQPLGCNHITVREAARRLNTSMSRIYRMDRISGPFPIAKIGRRVWLDLAGFDSYLSSTRDELAHAEPEPPALACDGEALHSSTPVDQHQCAIESAVPEVTAAIPAAARP